MSFRRRHRRGEKPKAAVDMTSLIDLTFLLLVTFIVTLPALEQSIHVLLPIGKTSKAQNEKRKNFTITVDSLGKIFVGDKPITFDELEAKLKAAVSEDEEINVLVRGDVRVGYGDVYEVVKLAKSCNIKHLGLVSVEQ